MGIPTLALSAVLSLTSIAALAGSAEDAEAHFQAIAKGDVNAVMADYGTDPVFQWIGGPLDGVYSGSDAIRPVWAKFAKGNAPLAVTVSGLEESANPKGSTVTANVLFKGTNAIKVRYVLTYRDGKLVNEIWQIDPKLNIGG